MNPMMFREVPMLNSVAELADHHRLKRRELALFLGWSPVMASRKLNNKRPWSYDEVDRAARWFRLHGVPVGTADLRVLVRISA